MKQNFRHKQTCVAAALFALAATQLFAQHHNASPPTAPAKPAPLAISGSGMGPLQISSVNYAVPSPQSLTLQLRGDDDRTRASALSALGVPAEYLQRGRTAVPHSIDLAFAELGTDDDIDAILTVEMEQHIVSAILIPDGDNWRRVATITFADPFLDTSNTGATFLRLERSLLAHNHYRAVFHSRTHDGHGDMSEYETHVTLANKLAVSAVSFASRERSCTVDSKSGTKSAHSGGCSLTVRWLRQDMVDAHRVTLITGTGSVSSHEEASMTTSPVDDALGDSHLRNFTCQPLEFKEQSQHFEPTANATSCFAK